MYHLEILTVFSKNIRNTGMKTLGNYKTKEQWQTCEATTSGGAHAKHAVSPGMTVWMWPLTAFSLTPLSIQIWLSSLHALLIAKRASKLSTQERTRSTGRPLSRWPLLMRSMNRSNLSSNVMFMLCVSMETSGLMKERVEDAASTLESPAWSENEKNIIQQINQSINQSIKGGWISQWINQDVSRWPIRVTIDIFPIFAISKTLNHFR